MEKTALDLEARLSAMEYMLMHLLQMSFYREGFTLREVEEVISASLEHVRSQAYPGFSDPVQSDQYAAAVEERLAKLLHGAKTMLAETQARIQSERG